MFEYTNYFCDKLPHNKFLHKEYILFFSLLANYPTSAHIRYHSKWLHYRRQPHTYLQTSINWNPSSGTRSTQHTQPYDGMVNVFISTLHSMCTASKCVDRICPHCLDGFYHNKCFLPETPCCLVNSSESFSFELNEKKRRRRIEETPAPAHPSLSSPSNNIAYVIWTTKTQHW